MKHIIKRNGKSQTYDDHKLYSSIYNSCLSVHESTAVAELTAKKVLVFTNDWLTNKTEVTGNDIRKAAGTYLTKIKPHAGYFYLHHRILW